MREGSNRQGGGSVEVEILFPRDGWPPNWKEGAGNAGQLGSAPGAGEHLCPLARRLRRQALLAVNSVYGCKTSFCARQFSNSPIHSTFSDGQASA